MMNVAAMISFSDIVMVGESEGDVITKIPIKTAAIKENMRYTETFPIRFKLIS
jgi:hypothetical protein